MNFRPLRVGKLIKLELNKIIIREIELEGALATITDIVVEKKLEYAKVLVSILPPERTNAAFRILKSEEGRLQHLLMKHVNIKPFPRIRFELDRGPENAATVEKRLLET